jgi:hypothetical protein
VGTLAVQRIAPPKGPKEDLHLQVTVPGRARNLKSRIQILYAVFLSSYVIKLLQIYQTFSSVSTTALLSIDSPIHQRLRK